MTTTFSKPLMLYIAFVVLVFSGYLYLQLNGIEVYSSTKTEHEGQDGTYGSSHSRHHSTHHYYHK
jgi:hypothetical protein